MPKPVPPRVLDLTQRCDCCTALVTLAEMLAAGNVETLLAAKLMRELARKCNP